MEETGAFHDPAVSPQYAAKIDAEPAVHQEQDRAAEGDPHDQGSGGGSQHGEKLAKLKGWV